MATIRATCHQCGDVELTTADVTVWVNAIDHKGTYSFVCPDCELTIAKPAEPRTIDLLLASGVAYQLSVPPVEVADSVRTGPPITSQELDGFRRLLDDDEQVWAAIESSKSQPHDRG